MKELKGRKLILILGMPLGLGCIYIGNPAFAIVTALIMILGIDEFFKMCELKGSAPNRIFGFIITLFVALAYAGIYSHHRITVLGFCCAAVISVYVAHSQLQSLMCPVAADISCHHHHHHSAS